MKIKDSQYSLINYLSSLQVYDIASDIDEIIENISRVTAEDVIKSVKKLNLGSIYFLRKGENRDK
jgi:predicted Zn-dependent peptidase